MEINVINSLLMQITGMNLQQTQMLMSYVMLGLIAMAFLYMFIRTLSWSAPMLKVIIEGITAFAEAVIGGIFNGIVRVIQEASKAYRGATENRKANFKVGTWKTGFACMKLYGDQNITEELIKLLTRTMVPAAPIESVPEEEE